MGRQARGFQDKQGQQDQQDQQGEEGAQRYSAGCVLSEDAGHTS
jgi:hypothetical protein